MNDEASDRWSTDRKVGVGLANRDMLRSAPA
jgi:hypothetical protein